MSGVAADLVLELNSLLYIQLGLFHLNIWGTRGQRFKKILWMVVGCKKLNLWQVAVIRKLLLWVVMDQEAKFLIKINIKKIIKTNKWDKMSCSLLWLSTKRSYLIYLIDSKFYQIRKYFSWDSDTLPCYLFVILISKYFTSKLPNSKVQACCLRIFWIPIPM